MRQHKIAGSRTAVWRFFQRHKITFKKSSARGGAAALAPEQCEPSRKSRRLMDRLGFVPSCARHAVQLIASSPKAQFCRAKWRKGKTVITGLSASTS
jgi:hypothetical protein